MPLEYFLATMTSEDSPKALLSLSPRIMRLRSQLWLVDLTPVGSYWQNRARMHNKNLDSYLREILQDQASFQQSALAQNPLQALLLLQHMHIKKLAGYLSVLSHFGQKMFCEQTWEGWWQSLHILGDLWKISDKKGFCLQRHHKQIHRMCRSIQRLQIPSPWHLHELSSLAIKRRFGQHIYHIWCWAFHPSQSEEDFPWFSYHSPDLPYTQRVMDFPVYDWNTVSAYLCADLDILARSDFWASHIQLLCLEWHLTFQDLSLSPLFIRFRHPHSLLQEIGSHRTVLLQASYQWNKHQRNTDFPQAISSWTLKVTEVLQRCDLAESLFEQISSLDNLLKIENQIPITLHTYHPLEHWHPDYIDTLPCRPDSALRPSLDFLNCKRPLFIFKNPIPIQPENFKILQFIESCAQPWWEGKISQKNYYLCQNNQDQLIWVSYDGQQFYMDGLFS